MPSYKTKTLAKLLLENRNYRLKKIFKRFFRNCISNGRHTYAGNVLYTVCTVDEHIKFHKLSGQ